MDSPNAFHIASVMYVNFREPKVNILLGLSHLVKPRAGLSTVLTKLKPTQAGPMLETFNSITHF